MKNLKCDSVAVNVDTDMTKTCLWGKSYLSLSLNCSIWLAGELISQWFLVAIKQHAVGYHFSVAGVGVTLVSQCSVSSASFPISGCHSV